jgi:hypothetical protein
MIQKVKNFRKKLIRKIAQTYANILIQRMQLSIDLEDDLSFWMAFEQAAKLDAYCVVFHEIYLD